jgi:hypothetical protein
LDRKIEDIRDDRKNGAEVEEAGEEVLKQLAFARAAFDKDKGAQEPNQEPSCLKPPRDLQGSVDHVEQWRAGQLQRFVGHNIGAQESDGEKDQEQDTHNRAPDRTCLEKKIRRETAEDKKGKDDNERIAQNCPCQVQHVEDFDSKNHMP